MTELKNAVYIGSAAIKNEKFDVHQTNAGYWISRQNEGKCSPIHVNALVHRPNYANVAAIVLTWNKCAGMGLPISYTEDLRYRCCFCGALTGIHGATQTMNMTDGTGLVVHKNCAERELVSSIVEREA